MELAFAVWDILVLAVRLVLMKASALMDAVVTAHARLFRRGVALPFKSFLI